MNHPRITDDACPLPRHAPPRCRLRVLASGSAGNCTLLQTTIADTRHTLLIDLGLSPRRTALQLANVGLTLDDIDTVLMTHLDIDHCHPGWSIAPGAIGRLPRRAEVFLPQSHVGRAQRAAFNGGRLRGFTGDFATAAGLCVRPVMLRHDSLGTAAFRLDLPSGSLGFATDIGRVDDALVGHLKGVHVLALESNYCEHMQRASDRPEFLKQRIMGGHGHLSNVEARDAVDRIGPVEHVVLLHLSRQCNDASIVAALHAGADYALTIASQTEPTRWVFVGSPRPQATFDAAQAVHVNTAHATV